MRVSKKRAYIAIAIVAALWSILGGIALSASLIQAADNSGASTNLSWNRAFLCSEVTEFCYAWGGGTRATSGNLTEDTYRYDPTTDTWSNAFTSNLPDEYEFLAHATGSNGGLMIATVNASETTSTNVSLLYNEATDTFTTVNPPPGFTGGFGFTATNIGNTYYLMEASSNIFTAWALDMENPGDGWTSQQDVYTESTLLQWARAVYDPDNEVIVMITRDNGLTWTFDPVTGQLSEDATDAFPPCNGAGSVCIPSILLWDASLGIVAGKQGDPSATSIGLYSFDVVAGTWSNSPVETLSNANFNYEAFTDGNSRQPLNASYTIDGITTTMFGGGLWITNSAAVPASEWFIRTGDPGGVSPTERNIDTWLTNFLTSLGLNSQFGRLLAGSLFAMILFVVLAIKGVPWIISLGIAGLATTFLTVALIFNPAILLGLVAIIMVGGMGLLFALIMGGDRNG